MPNDLPLVIPAFEAATKALRTSSEVEAAIAQTKDEADLRIKEQIQLTETPSPSFKEGERAKVFSALLKNAGLEDITVDCVGNVISRIKGEGNGPVLVIAAHMDTVFPEGTPIKVRQEGTRYFAPGISDDACGLANLLQVVRSIKGNNIKTVGDIVVVGTVGEDAMVTFAEARISGTHPMTTMALSLWILPLATES